VKKTVNTAFHNRSKTKVAVVGASGYAGEELVSLLLRHPYADLVAVTSAHRGQEIDEKTFEAHAETIFDQAENRLHVQKAFLAELGRQSQHARARAFPRTARLD